MSNNIHMEDVNRISVAINDRLAEILKETYPDLVDSDDFINVWENDCFDATVEILDKELKANDYQHHN